MGHTTTSQMVRSKVVDHTETYVHTLKRPHAQGRDQNERKQPWSERPGRGAQPKPSMDFLPSFLGPFHVLSRSPLSLGF